MRKTLLSLASMLLITIGSLTCATDNEFIVHDADAGTITVYAQDKSYGITIQDKNLGATTVGTGEESYGYYYQWGNNHGNPLNSETTTTLLPTNDLEDWVNKGYSGAENRFIEIKNTGGHRDYWSNFTNGQGAIPGSNYDKTGAAQNNLWGGGNDIDDNNQNIVKGYDIENHIIIHPENRQGPCPVNYHVPSAGEWHELTMLWCNANPNICIENVVNPSSIGYTRAKYLSGNEIGTAFSNELILPLAGNRSYIDSYFNKNGLGFYWSSSPRGGTFIPETAWFLNIGTNKVDSLGENAGRAMGGSIRCFKNSYVKLAHTVNFLDDGLWVASGSVENGDTRSETVPTPSEKTGYNFEYRYVDGGDDSTGFDFSTPITADLILQAKWSCATGYKDNGGVCVINKDIVIEATATEADQTLKINKYFKNAYTVDWGDGTTGNLTADTTHTYTGAGTYTIILSLSGANRWTFQNVTKPLVSNNGTSMTGVKIITMPSLADGFGANATTPGNYFFYNFNNGGALISLPDGSFDTSNIMTAGDYVFRAFNYKGLLTSLPSGSFNISNITTVGNNFFANFNYSGVLIVLPAGSFDTSKITKVGNNFFWQFNTYGSLESLPDNSFNISNISGSVGNEFFRNFNWSGNLTSLPDNSFNISNISGSVGTKFFYGFNHGGALTSLPAGSFDTSHITAAGDEFFNFFNSNGELISLPENSFNISKITTVGNYFFGGFNQEGNLISLPNGSFRLSTGLITVGTNFFRSFNSNGALTSLPTGSFDTSNITTVGEDFFRTFNNSGQITSLPDGSFNTSYITVVGNNFFYQFDNNGSLTDLPYSFIMNSIGASATGGYRKAFNSPNYTINKKVSDLVSGVTVPLDDRDTFSDNQPGRCGVYPNWLVNPENACNVLYDANGGIGTTTGGYNSDTTGVVVGSGIVEPTRTGYTLSGWRDVSGNNIEEVLFSEMDGQTLYANRQINQYTITFDLGDELIIITGDYGSPITKPSNPKKEGYTFKGRESEIPATMPAEDMNIKAVWEKNGSSGGGGGGGGGGGSSNSSSGSTSTGSDTSNNPSNQATGSGVNNSTGTQNDQATTGTNIKEPENGTGSNVQTGSQADSQQAEQTSEQAPQNESNVKDSPANASEGQNYSQEFQQAYEFAHENGITTMPTIQQAQMDGKLTRIAMAKMLSQYAMNILGQKPENIDVPKFNDVTEKMDSDYDEGVTLAYQLGIMGQNMPNNKFRPNDEVTRAEFATALSRMIYKTSDGEYKGTGKYYIHHMEKLVKEGIITKDDPKMKELRGYVMIMLMRSAK